MYRFTGGRGTGKTYKLFEEANKVGGLIICSNPIAMRTKAKMLGFENIDFIGYDDTSFYYCQKPTFIDEIENYLNSLTKNNLAGYTYTIIKDESN